MGSLSSEGSKHHPVCHHERHHRNYCRKYPHKSNGPNDPNYVSACLQTTENKKVKPTSLSINCIVVNSVQIKKKIL